MICGAQTGGAEYQDHRINVLSALSSTENRDPFSGLELFVCHPRHASISISVENRNMRGVTLTTDLLSNELGIRKTGGILKSYAFAVAWDRSVFDR